MNNAGIGLPSKSWEGIDAWRKTFDVNVYGCVRSLVSSATPVYSSRRFASVLNVQQTFVPSMIHQENPAVIINTGSKQGITNPP